MDSQNQSEHDDEIEVAKYGENEEDKEETKRSNAAVSKTRWPQFLISNKIITTMQSSVASISDTKSWNKR